MSSATKQKSSAGKNVLIFFIVFIILEAGILLLISKVIFKNKDVTPTIAGYSLYLMDSTAMGDSVPQGSLVIASNNTTPSVDKIGEAIVCENVPGVGTSVFRLYDISEAEDKSGVIYTIYQENDPNKLYQIKSKNIVGTASSYYRTAGKVLNFVISKFGFIVCLAVPVFLLIVIELIIAIATGSSYEDDEDDDDEDEFEKGGENENVSLDDFLFGGQNEGEQIANHLNKQNEQQTVASDDGAFAQQTYAPQEEIRFEPENKVQFSKPAEQEAPAAVQTPAPRTIETPSFGDDNDLKLDLNAPAARSTAARRPVRRRHRTTAARPRPTEKTSAPSAGSSAQSLEDLMKLMEQEQQKLKDQLNNNNKQ